MRIVLQHNRTGALEIADVPPPLLGQDGVLVQTAFSLISVGTERTTRELAQKSLLGKALARPDQVRQVLNLVQRDGINAAYQRVSARLDTERPLGYSASGIVIEVGERVAKSFTVGQRVACAGGGYANHAEIVFVPHNLCSAVPDEVSLDAAAYATVGAIALQAVRQADVRLGEVAAVVGLGLVGLLVVQLLAAAGCKVVGYDTDSERCELARELGAWKSDHPGDAPQDMSRLLPTGGVDAVVITAATGSSEPVRLAARLCRDRGRIVVVGAVGMDIPREPFYRKELELRLSRSYGPGRYDSSYEERGVDYPIGYVRWTEGRNIAAFLDFMRAGRVDVARLTSHRFSIEQAEEAYRVVEGRTGARPLGVMFEYPERLGVRCTTVVLPSALPAVSESSPGVGLIGSGNFARGVLLPALRAASSGLLSFRGVASATGVSARVTGRRFGFAFCSSSADDVLADLRTSGVVITTRHDQHAALVVRALAAGKTVFVEKPLAVTRAELAAVIEAQQRSGRSVVVGFNRRYARLTQEVLDHFSTCNEPLLISVRVNAGDIPADHWTRDPVEGGGRILGEACHFVDLMICLARSAPVDVEALALPGPGGSEPDSIQATFRFKNGALGTLSYVSTGDSSLPKERIEVIGGGRAAVLDDFRELRLFRDGKHRRVSLAGSDKGHQREMALLVELLTTGRSSLIPFSEAVVSTIATISILESIKGGKRVSVDEVSTIDPTGNGG